MGNEKLPLVDCQQVPFAVAEAAPFGETFPTHGHQLSTEVLRELIEKQNLPDGLTRELGNTIATYPIRFWVVDNSGSMQNPDGNELRVSGGATTLVSCTR